MFSRTRELFHTKVVLSIFFMFVLAETSNSQSTENEEVDRKRDAPQEEIVVYGDKSLRTLRLEMYDAQENFFSVFNSLNSDDDLNVECGFLQPLSVRRKYRVCAPRFAERAQASAASEFTLGMALAGMQRRVQNYNALSSSAFPHDAVARRKEKKMWQEMEALLAERPELREALAELIKTRESYESARQRDR